MPRIAVGDEHEMCVAGKRKLEGIRRFDVAGFEPDAAYVRELKKYGVLKGAGAMSVYEMDRRYWESLWYGR
ncbi:MAG: hypothetical protein NTU53_13480 [Planctomycetota bacterium]|nr:hypothetical protein [Planctomycetota bacterium]